MRSGSGSDNGNRTATDDVSGGQQQNIQAKEEVHHQSASAFWPMHLVLIIS